MILVNFVIMIVLICALLATGYVNYRAMHAMDNMRHVIDNQQQALHMQETQIRELRVQLNTRGL